MIVSVCPHCGSLSGDNSEVARMKREMSKRLQLMLETLLLSEPTGISRADLAIRMYGSAIGKSSSGFVRLGNDLSELRRKIDRFGYFVPSLGADRPTYRILPLEEAAC